MNYKDLKVWHKSMDLVAEIYALVKKFPKEETYALSDQLRRAVVSIPSNIAEGSRRNTTKDFIQFLCISSGSNAEVETQLLISIRIGLITKEQAKDALELVDEITKMLGALIGKLKLKN